ncbi:MAG: rhodanese-like domain-containing protein [Casimicrobiaceae bacterium]|nr:rhodanese-like domain-containing protein [Casimicrobiaceae bacterium]MCX8098173.1 rhodanese-like domain-containing protein [Casimicrobiaceae bacterium]MDW8312779.1 rhodanese-like domain-containing protein [Burkholderiales bacterium]
MSSSAAQRPEMISLDEARALLDAGVAKLVDIREPSEHATGVAPGAVLLPLSQLQERFEEFPEDRPEAPVLVICRTQNRSGMLVAQLRSRFGREHVHAVRGGMLEWAQRGWPLVPPRP